MTTCAIFFALNSLLERHNMHVLSASTGQDAIRQIESTVVVGTDVVAPMSPDSKVNILLVDDQPARLLAYEAILQDLGQNLICARSGTEALE